MQKHDVQRGILSGWKYVEALELGGTISSAWPLEVNEEFRKLALSETTSYLSLFLCGLRLSHYNFQLFDYSYFQFGCTPPDDVRYAYYPNPYFSAKPNTAVATLKELTEMLRAEELTSEDYLTLLSEMRPDVRIPPIRYENAPSQYKVLEHPASHFHIGHHANNRWPLDRVLTPAAFILLILKRYYGDTWSEFWTNKDGNRRHVYEEALIKERRESVALAPEQFADVERRSFYFS